MANDDLLQQFRKLLEENNKQLRQEVREDTKAEIKAEVEPLHERRDTQYKNLSGQINTVKTELSEQISREAHDMGEIIRDAIIPKLDQHDEDIEELQKAVGLRPKH